MTEGPAGTPLGLKAIRAVVRQVRETDAPVVLFSLWRSVLAFTAIRVLFPKKKLVLFLHSSRAVHLADALSTRWMTLLADEIWADSPATLALRLPGHVGRPNSRTISFVLERIDASSPSPPIDPRFVSWCRLSREKRIDLALDLIADLSKRTGGVTYSVIGPDAGTLGMVKAKCHALGLDSSVKFLGPMDREEIANAAAGSTFFLQLSSQEGQSMAVVEAMQLGLIPVVTPVGAIPEYCFDGRNALIFDGVERTAARLADLLASPDELRRLSAAARTQFSETRLYIEDITAAAETLAHRQS